MTQHAGRPLQEGAIAGSAPAPVSGASRRASVLVPILQRPGGPAVLFTERAADLSEHPGQMSFPGGGVEPQDDSLLETALREATEEIGLSREAVRIVGPLDDVHTVTDYAVRPHVARIPDRDYAATDREVSAIAVVPVAELLDPAAYEVESRSHPFLDRVPVHYFHVGAVTVWGATARMLVQLLERGFEWHPPRSPE